MLLPPKTPMWRVRGMSDRVLETVEETAKATGEVAKLSARVPDSLDPALKPLAQLLGSVLSVPADGVGFVADFVKAQRVMNAERLNEKVAAARAARAAVAQPATPPLSFALPLLEQATLVDDDELQTWWANLIVSAVDQKAEPRKAYVDILSSMTAADAKILADVNRRSQYNDYGDPPKGWTIERYQGGFRSGVSREDSETKIPRGLLDLTLDNLLRLGCISAEIKRGEYSSDGYERVFSVTRLGESLVKACTPPQDDRRPQR